MTLIPLIKNSKLVGSYINAQGQQVKVYVTQAYDDFKFSTANRPVNVGRVTKIIASMNNNIEHAPILVNEKGELMDGQHRLEAYRRLDRPITFEMIEGLTEDTIRRLNTIQKEWTIQDHLHAGAVENDISYKWMDNFCKVNSILPTVAIVLVKGHTATSGVIDEIRAGTFQCSVEERRRASERMIVLDRLRGYSKAASKNFASALVKILELPKIDVERLVTTFQARYKQVLPGIAGSYESYLFQMQEMYNYRTTEDKKLRFLTPAELERLNRKG